jgi:HSP20 family protein
MSPQELQLQEKREVEKQEEQTTPARTFLATADIFETESALTVVLEMPGVNKDAVDISIKDDVLTVSGRLDFSKYEGLQPIYTEYNIGNFRRSFALSNKIDQDKISAEIRDGVLTLILPKAEEARSRRIEIS